MKKLIWSTFAMSLILLPLISHGEVEFLGMEKELMPDLAGKQKFSPLDLHESKDLQVRPEMAIQDVAQPNKGQKYSIIPWSELDATEWLDINNWLIERELKDKKPDWKIRLRDSEHRELAGKFLKCQGSCSVYRGSTKAQTGHLSRIEEGDEIHTDEDSVAWIYFMEGSLMRLSPQSSLSVQEINLGKGEVFLLVRLNKGHFYWHPRHKADYPLELAPETDSFSLPLMVRQANVNHFARERFKAQSDEERLKEVMDLDEGAIKDQIQALNKLKNEHNPLMNHRTKIMVVSPNASVTSSQASFDYLYYPGGKTYFKKRTFELGEEFTLHLRGYTDNTDYLIDKTEWYEVDGNGRSYSQLVEIPSHLQITELITKRIKTIELARELWVKEFTIPMMKVGDKAELLARNFGYNLWGDELSKRQQFLVEYTRRIETTNLRSLENLITKLEDSGEMVKKDLADEHYKATLKHYLLGLKSRYDRKSLRVAEMNDLQYYVWILKNGKF